MASDRPEAHISSLLTPLTLGAASSLTAGLLLLWGFGRIDDDQRLAGGCAVAVALGVLVIGQWGMLRI
ncbi:hypothetical protein OPKNFCMD_2152 [Methylobacterium crusticola]|uniref:Uncharacterized protein n=1 Tax=Methylobacterium crusticola TaxID=1697972 RepID=A0ABQ4QVN3_9HYPH|nr:hypothetical protein OPKNFCMD_2152 [Methylobacterium crusticola]